MAEPRPKAVVAMSGGVDSSVAAALLAREGFEVIGVTLQLLACDQEGQAKSCCGFETAERAREVADQLGLAHYTLDCQQAFSDRVLAPAWRAYTRGQTPNPCVWCNRHIKFGELLDFSQRLGATVLASGHHARLRDRPGGAPLLCRGRDPNKDQSYFLYALTPEQRARLRFPIGDLDKPAVRALAREMGLAVADSPESQDACFVTGERSFPESLRVRFGQPPAPGTIEDDRGRAVGRHDGIHAFTVGQRRGLGVALGRPAWVRALDPVDRRVLLTTDPDRLLSRSLVADELVIGDPAEELRDRPVSAQIRYRHPAAAARLHPLPDGRLRIRFEAPQRAITAGQAVVFYEGDQVLGGGRICQVEDGHG